MLDVISYLKLKNRFMWIVQMRYENNCSRMILIVIVKKYMSMHVSNIWEQKNFYESWYETVIWDVGYVRDLKIYNNFVWSEMKRENTRVNIKKWEN